MEFFVKESLINDDFATKLLGWKHSGFSIESGTRIYDERARESLSQYIVRAPVSLEKLYWDGETDTVLWHAPRKGLFKGEDRYFSGLDFIAQLTLRIPPKGKHLVRRFGVYSSRARGTWKKRPALRTRAAEQWYGWDDSIAPVQAEAGETVAVTKRASRKAWARLLAKVYEIDVLQCPQCGGRMSVIAVIRDPQSTQHSTSLSAGSIREIINCMDPKGRGPP